MAKLSDEYIAKVIACGPEQVGQVVFDMAVEIQRLRGIERRIKAMRSRLAQL